MMSRSYTIHRSDRFPLFYTLGPQGRPWHGRPWLFYDYMNSNMPPREPPNDDRDTFKFVVLATGRSQKGCGMAFIKKPFRRLAEGAGSEADTYIALAELSFEDEGR